MPKLRAGSEAAADLLASDSVEEWTRAYQSYDQSVRRLSQEKGRAGLVEVDHWFKADLPAILRSRGAEPYLTKEELVKVVQWKLWMGVVRPNLLRFANESDPGKVKMTSREAFCHLPRPHPSETEHRSETDGVTPRASATATRKAVSALTSDLKGVGPATASAILSAVCGDCPFDADEVIDAVMKTGVRKYSLNEYLEVQEVLAAKADRLGTPWNAERVRKAIWSRAMHSRFGLDPPAEGTSLSGNRGACPSRKERTAGRHDAGTRAEEGNGLRGRRKSSSVGGIHEGGNGNGAKRRKSRR